MRLSWKYLLPLNAVILTIWGLHALWTIDLLEEEFLDSERRAIKHLAVGLKHHIEHELFQDSENAFVEHSFDGLIRQVGDVDIMVIDTNSIVRIASNPKRLELTWREEAIDAVLSGEKTLSWNLRDHSHDKRRAMDITMGIRAPSGELEGVIHVARWLDELEQALADHILGHVFAAVSLLVLVAVAVNVITHRTIIRPVLSLRKQIARSGWFDSAPAELREDAIEQLRKVVDQFLITVQQKTKELEGDLARKQDAVDSIAAARDDLKERVNVITNALEEARRRLVTSERLAAMGQLSAGLAHEIRNPLHIVRATAETARRRFPQTEELCGDIVEEVDRIESLIKKLLIYTQSVRSEWDLVDATEILEAARNRLCRGKCHGRFENCGVCAVEIAPQTPLLNCDSMLMEQAVLNLVSNALEASEEKSPVSICARGDDKGGVIIEVADRGGGIAEEDMPNIFDPFFTRKPSGTGLGLAIVQKIADLHRGTIKLRNRRQGGVVAQLHIPHSPRGDER